MKLLKGILSQLKKFDQGFQNDGITWMEYKQQWLEENNINCN